MEDSTLSLKTDFPDWFSPMLVKELRQGMRTRVFVIVFILLQVLMLLDVSLSLLVAANGADTSTGTVFFWIMVGLPVLLIVPTTGLNSVGGEIKANTLELIFLTRLTAFRIIFGKWLANFAQSLLLVSAVLPYLVLRYFMGGVNLTSELLVLGAMLAGSALLSALATGFSPYPARIVRPVAAFFGFGFFIFGINIIGTLVFEGPVVAGAGPNFMETAGLLACGALFLFLMLEVGAVKIAPPAENHSAAMRLLAASGLVLALAAGFVVPRAVTITTTTFLIAAVVCAVALCEQPRWIPTLFRPFAARGLPGRTVGKFLYPGWYSGFLFTLAVFGASGALLAHQKAFSTPAFFVQFVALGGTLLLPVAIVRLFFPKTDRATAFFFGFQGLCLLVTIFCMVCDNVLKTSLKHPASFLPLATLFFSVGDEHSDTATRLGPVVIVTLASVVALFVAAARPLRQAHLAEKASLQPSDAPLA